MHLSDTPLPSNRSEPVMSLPSSLPKPQPQPHTAVNALPATATAASPSSSSAGSLPPFVPGVSSTSSSSAASSGSSSPSPSQPGVGHSSHHSSVRVRHDKQRRNASEVRRRGEMRDAFRALQSACRCPHSGRYNILSHAAAVIRQMQQRERDRESDGGSQQQSSQLGAGREPDEPASASASTLAFNQTGDVSVDEQLEQQVRPTLPSTMHSSLPAATLSSASSSRSSSNSTSSSSSSVSPSTAAASASNAATRSSQLCALTVCHWLPMASCVCDLNGRLLTANAPLLRLLSCPSLSFCLQRLQSLYAIIDQTSARLLQQRIISQQRLVGYQQRMAAASEHRMPSAEQQHSTAVKRVKSEYERSKSALKPEMESVYGARHHTVDANNSSDGGASLSGYTAAMSVSSPTYSLTDHAVAAAAAARRPDMTFPPMPLSNTPSASEMHRRSSLPAASNSPTATSPVMPLSHPAVVSLSSVGGVSRDVQLTAWMTSIRDSANDWRPALVCIFTTLPVSSSDSAAYEVDTSVMHHNTAVGAMSSNTDVDEHSGETFGDWNGNVTGGVESIIANSNKHQMAAMLRQQLNPHTLHQQPYQQRSAPVTQPYAASSWQPHVEMEQPTAHPPYPSGPSVALSAPSTSSAYQPPPDTAIAAVYSYNQPSGVVKLPSVTSDTLHRNTNFGEQLSSLHSYIPSYSESMYHSATASALSLPFSTPLSSTTSSVSTSTSLYAAAGYAPDVSMMAAPVASSSASMFAATQQQLDLGTALSLSPKSLAHRLLSNLYR